jgi:beta-glucosidase
MRVELGNSGGSDGTPTRSLPGVLTSEMRVKLDGFSGGDRISIDLPAAQQKLLKPVASTGKPVIVVMQSGSAVALN